MGWPKRRRQGHSQKENSVLGGQFHAADTNIEKLCKRVAYATMDFPYVAKDVIPWLFEAETIDRLRKAYGLTPLYDKWVSYDVAQGASLTIDYEDTLRMLSAADTMLHIDSIAAAPLLDTVEHFREIHVRFQQVRHVMCWLDENCTAGAIRQYWPTMAALAPACEEVQGGAPTRYTEPKVPIGPMLTLIRETQATVAGALLLPDKAYSANKGLKLDFDSIRLTHASGVEFTAQSIVFPL